MTREEAISVLKETIDPNIDKSFMEWKEWDKEKHLPAVNMAIDALQAEQKHGHWIERAKCEYRCDQCGKIVFADDENELNYCCCCGAKMKRRKP